MGLTFKIAIGVFLGVIAAFVAIKAPGWIAHAQTEWRYIDAERAMQGMTPDLAIQRCGKPDKDVTSTAANGRLIYYKNQSALASSGVVLDFVSSENGGWRLLFVYEHSRIVRFEKTGYAFAVDAIGDTPKKPISEDPGSDNRAWRELIALPCLEGK